MRKDYKSIIQRDNLCGEIGITIAATPQTPLCYFFTHLAGIETTIHLLADELEEMEKVIHLMEKLQDKAYQIIAESPAVFVVISDNLSSEIMSPNLFERYVLPYYKKRNRQLHDAGKFTLVHLDGRIGNLPFLLRDSGFDAIEALTPAPVGDLSPKEIRERAGDKLILWGGLPGAMFSSTYPEQMFREHIVSYLKSYIPNPRFVLGVGDQVPPDADINRVKMVPELVNRFGSY